MAQKNSKSLYLVALALFLGGIGYLLFSGFTQNSVYFLNVSEALATPQDKLHTVRLFGTVAADGLTMLDGAPGVRFRLEDKDNTSKTVWVLYKGAVPDTFKPGVEVIIEGGLAPGEDTFKARTLMTKCPSKYQKENRG
ncbi:cytochrome c maturation protein CcmE [Nitratidesulfovibrio vulgaris]|uniref:Cytochrome c-type biogenesis protein CcmE n=1 Tax=Nitratidesulfovibrio vulgaris (strain ATCC 29579 / DSM 644 / CCUG 34227 / NCIMB 8303 / VKM B-1760 / Hildenborough) TaxID=882 RepID=Q72D78_NITV2|nr:cytochrome c maturation protein CcmE [Nitratidesulfovibrio vulgaris]AAS95531.1 cytochrome c-type biogenesis protein CcmE [Nitratidesulfovibrio vulgaris str. Hildenborough]ADP86134.1 cytochrome c-type biogenesis protein CcmE [Nitratidesulfovibrio vulgaris RCH1]